MDTHKSLNQSPKQEICFKHGGCVLSTENPVEKNLFSNIFPECFPLNDPWYNWVSTLVFTCQKTYCKFPTSYGSTSLGSQHKLVKLSLCENLKHSSLDPKVGTQLGIEKCYLNCWQHFLKQMSPRSNQDYQDISRLICREIPSLQKIQNFRDQNVFSRWNQTRTTSTQCCLHSSALPTFYSIKLWGKIVAPPRMQESLSKNHQDAVIFHRFLK